jgi:hypothetical protein
MTFDPGRLLVTPARPPWSLVALVWLWVSLVLLAALVQQDRAKPRRRRRPPA